jgi:exonuclease III
MIAPWSLNVATLNCKGMTNAVKRRRVFAWLRQHRVDVVCLQETHCISTDIADWSFGWGAPHLSLWSHSADDSRSAGTTLLFNRRRFCDTDINSQQIDVNGRFIVADITVAPSVVIRVAGVYAPNAPGDRQQFFIDLQESIESLPTNHSHDILLGDFNCISDPILDRIRGSLVPSSLTGSLELAALASSLSTVDIWRHLHPTQQNVTWRSNTVGSRLDRIFVDRGLSQFATCSQFTCSSSDHDLIICKVDAPLVQRGRSYWKLNTSALSSSDYQEKITRLIDTITARTDLTISDRWDLLKDRVRDVSIKFGTAQKKLRTTDMDFATQKHSDALRAWADNASDENVTKLRDAKTELDNLEHKQYQAAAIRSRVTWLLKGERCTRYFCSLEKSRASANIITALQHPITNVLSTTVNDLCDTAAEYNERLYTPEQDIDEDAVKELLVHMPTIPDAQRNLLDAEITLEELKAAVKKSPTNKCPGLDGIPVDFFATFFTQLGPLLLDVFNSAVATGMLPKSCRSGVICLLHKKGNRQHMNNYRPLTMLAADYKLFSKVMAERLDPVLQTLIHPDQSGFIRTRQITDNLNLTRLVQSYYKRNKLKGCIVFLDQQKAFDRVHWRYRDLVLEHCNFGDRFRGIISLLHQDITAQVQVNGHLSRSIKIHRGTRQGDPLSPGLFVLLEEPFACALRADTSLRGIPIPDERQHSVKLSQFADDKAIYLSCDADYSRLKHHLQRYELASGAKINTLKSSALLLGAAILADFPSLDIPPLLPGSTTKYLGVLFGPSITDEQVWQAALDRFTTVLRIWKQRDLSFSGRVVVLRSLASSVLWYTAAIVPPPKPIITLLERTAYKFLWNDKQSTIDRTTALVPRRLGGIGMIDIASVCAAFQLKIIKQYLSPGDAAWKGFFAAELCSQRVSQTFNLGTRVLLAQPTPSHHQLEPFWHGIVLNSHKLHFKDDEPSSYEDVNRQHLFLNHFVRDSNFDTLGSEAMVQAAQRHIGQVINLPDLEHNGVSAVTANRIRRAVPDDWMQLLDDGPAPPSLGEYFMADFSTPPRQVFQVRHIDRDNIHLSALDVNKQGFIQRTTAQQLILDKPDFNYNRAHVTDVRGQQLVVNALSTSPLIPSQLSILQLVGNKIKRVRILDMTINATTTMLTGLKQSLPVFEPKWRRIIPPNQPWPRILKWIWCRDRNRKVNDMLFKMLHQRLPLGENRNWSDDVACPCGLDLETHQHLFAECTISHQFLRWFQSVWRNTTGHNIIINNPMVMFSSVPPTRIHKTARAKWRLFAVVHGEAMYSLWLQRCKFIFDGDDFKVQNIISLFKSRIRLALESAQHLKRIDGFNDLVKSFFSHLDAPI